MAIDFSLAAPVADVVARTAAFVRASVLPVEDALDGVADDLGTDQRLSLQDAARAAGVFCPQGPTAYGGLGLGMSDRAAVFEEAGYSLFGPLVLNCAAPDEGNMHLLDVVATAPQRERYLEPLVRGQVRSSFAMTEPSPGAGSDPAGLTTAAARVGDSWRISGRKVFITGADGAAFYIVMARTAGAPGDRGGATMFLVDAATPGLTVQRHIRTLDRSMAGGHCEVSFDGVEVGPDAILGELDEGFRYAQVRLGPARMTHCMRWLGAARRAHDVAVDRAVVRPAFGGPLADLGMVQQMIAESEIDIEASRALILRACWELDGGGAAARSTAIAKAFVAEAAWRVVDRAVQICGGLGVSEDLPVARILREVRAFRIYDGPTEVHRWSIARRAARAARDRS